MNEAVFKLITKDNWELIAAFLRVNPGSIKRNIGMWVYWTGVPGEADWTLSPRVPELYVTVTDGYIADRAYTRKKQ